MFPEAPERFVAAPALSHKLHREAPTGAVDPVTADPASKDFNPGGRVVSSSRKLYTDDGAQRCFLMVSLLQRPATCEFGQSAALILYVSQLLLLSGLLLQSFDQAFHGHRPRSLD